MNKKLLMYLLWHSMNYKHENSLEQTKKFFLLINNGPSAAYNDTYFENLRYNIVVNQGDRFTIDDVNTYAEQNHFVEITKMLKENNDYRS